MDGLAYRLLATDEFELAVISLVAVAVFAAIAAALYRPAWTMSRLPYVATLCVCLATGQLSYLLRCLYFEALDLQQLGRLAFAFVLIWIAIGAIVGIASAARARDAFGGNLLWPLVFVPLANLLLMVAPSRQARRTRIGSRASEVVLVACGCVLVGLTLNMPGVSQDYLERVGDARHVQAELGANIAVDPADSEGLEATLRDMVAKAPLPDTLEARVISIEVHGDVVETVMQVEDDNMALDADWRDETTASLCFSGTQALLLDKGATLKTTYRASNGQLLSDLTLNTDICNAFRAPKEREIIAVIEALDLPQNLSDEVAIIGASYKDKTVTYRYAFTARPPTDSWKAAAQGIMCEQDEFRRIVRLGIKIKVEFDLAEGENSVPLGQFVMTATTCSANAR